MEASGNKLVPVLIFKGTTGKTIEKRLEKCDQVIYGKI
jgi:hypothetical protein